MSDGLEDRTYWLGVLERIARVPLTALAQRRLREVMPVEAWPGLEGERREVAHLELLGRLLAGIAPWLETGSEDGAEGLLRHELLQLSRKSIAAAVDPASPDFMNFTVGRQPLVDAAFLAQAILRAPRTLWHGLDATTQRQLVSALRSTRVHHPPFNNWLLFAATIEAALCVMGESDWDVMRVDYALRQHDQWYKGDGAYGDGPAFHWDYYNAFVIQPMLIDVLNVVTLKLDAWNDLPEKMLERARRFAAVQERMISPEGTFPPVGRSLAYRFGALQGLTQMALLRQLPEEVSPAQARSAMTRVIRRMVEAPGTFDADGWLTIGFAGHQPGVGEAYISTGSVYLCAAGLLPLGLPASDEFWSTPARPWTAQLAWGGKEFPIDKTISV